MERPGRLQILRDLRDSLQVDSIRRKIGSEASEDWLRDAATLVRKVSPKHTVSLQAIQGIFKIWMDTLPSGRVRVLTASRKKLIVQRLAEYGYEDVALAVQGWTVDPWSDRVKHCDITILLRTPESTEKFRDLMAEQFEKILQKPVGPENGSYNLDRTHRWDQARGIYVPAGEWGESE